MADLAQRAAEVGSSSGGLVAPYGPLRTAAPYILADLHQRYPADPAIWGEELTGGGTVTHVYAAGETELGVTGTSGDKAVFQTHQHYRSQPGLETRVMQSVSSVGLDAGIRARAGFFDDGNGVFWEIENGVPYMVIRSDSSGSVVDSKTPSFSGNELVNRSKVAKLVPGYTNLLSISFLWLGSGGAKFLWDELPVHSVSGNNMSATSFMRVAQLPIRYELECIAAASEATMCVQAAAVHVIGGDDPPGLGHVEQVSFTWSASTPTVAFSVRPSETFFGVDSRVGIVPTGLEVNPDVDTTVYAYLDASLTGPSWSQITDSAMELDTTASASTGGTALAVSVCQAGVPTRISFRDIFARNGRSFQRLFPSGTNVLTFVVEKAGGASSTVDITLGWDEVT